MANEKILVVDDDPNILEVIQMRLKAWGYQVAAARNGKTAKAALSETPFNLVIIDLRLSDENGISLMEEIFGRYPNLPLIILTAHGSIESAVEAMRKGAYSYLTKPFNNEDLLLHIKNALEKQHLTKEIEHLRKQLDERNKFKHIIGKSKKMQEILDLVSKMSKTDNTVAIYGESGTGKELIARAIHQDSKRSKHPFIAVNCGAIPEEILEDDLFGHVGGATKEAHKAKEGFLKQADGGAIFFNGIGNLSPALQIKLLQVLQDNEYKPYGGTRNVKVNVRVIIASNTDLRKAVNEGAFREDLFYKIHVVPIYLPPLRERRDDIPLLATYFMTGFSRVLKKNVLGFTPAATQRMLLYDWPGNIRELQNKVEHAVIMANKDVITTEDVFADSNTLKNTFNSYKDAKERFECEYLENLLKMCKGNVTSASKIAKRYRADIYKLIKKYHINPEHYKDNLVSISNAETPEQS